MLLVVELKTQDQKVIFMVKNTVWWKNSNKKHLEETGYIQMCCHTEKTKPFFLNNAIKGSIIWPIFLLCLDTIYCERQDSSVTMGRGTIWCRSPSASWSKPHTSDSVYCAASTAIHFIDLKKKQETACQGHSSVECNANQETQASIVRDGVFASPHQCWNILHLQTS